MAKQARGKRYSAAEKQEITDFANSINAEKGRGGVAQASRKFGVSQLTIANWLKKEGSPTTGAGKSGKGAAVKAGKGGFGGQLRRLADLHDEIAATEKKLAELQKEFAKLKKKL